MEERKIIKIGGREVEVEKERKKLIDMIKMKKEVEDEENEEKSIEIILSIDEIEGNGYVGGLNK